MAKKKTVDLGGLADNLNIKLADGKKQKASKPDQLDIDSPVDKDLSTNEKYNVVDRAINICQQIENLSAELGEEEKHIKDVAGTAVQKSKDSGDFAKTVNVHGTSLKIQVQFRDSYSKMDVSMEDPLKKIFGEKYPIMFRKDESEWVRPDKQAELKTLLGDKYDIYFDKDDSIKPTADFQYNYFLLKATLKPEQIAVVQKILDTCQSSPAIKYPK